MTPPSLSLTPSCSRAGPAFQPAARDALTTPHPQGPARRAAGRGSRSAPGAAAGLRGCVAARPRDQLVDSEPAASAPPGVRGRGLLPQLVHRASTPRAPVGCEVVSAAARRARVRLALYASLITVDAVRRSVPSIRPDAVRRRQRVRDPVRGRHSSPTAAAAALAPGGGGPPARATVPCRRGDHAEPGRRASIPARGPDRGIRRGADQQHPGFCAGGHGRPSRRPR